VIVWEQDGRVEKEKAPVKMGRKTPGPKRLGLGESEPFTRSGREAGSAGLQRSKFMTTVCQKSSYHPSSLTCILIDTTTDDFLPFVGCSWALFINQFTF
jgi:hypothetical protein